MGKRLGRASLRRQSHDDYLGDRISQLPDDILVSILSCLPLKEAQSTSILSRRWRYLWASVPVLNFDASEALNYLRQKNDYTLLETERPRYINWVNQVLLRSHLVPNLDEFRIVFDLDQSSHDDIDGWVRFAIKQGVRKLELDFSPYYGGGRANCYCFPNICFITECLRTGPSRFSCHFLTALVLKKVDVTGEVVEYFLSTCPFLEELVVQSSDSLVDLRIVGPSLPLKYLDLSWCYSLKNIEICATNLVSFKHFGPKVTFSFMNVPRLVNVSIMAGLLETVFHNALQLSRYFSLLETLTLEAVCFEELLYIKHLKIPDLLNLKELELIVCARDDRSLLWFASLMKASPNLGRFKLELSWWDDDPEMEMQGVVKINAAPPCPHQNLKVVELVGFVGAASDVEVAMYLLENALSLEKIIIDPHQSIFESDGYPPQLRETSERVARDRAKLLVLKLPVGVQLIIL